MLRKDMRKKLQEHTWLELARKDSNRSDTLSRLTDEANRAINDLALLARRLPNDRQSKIFSEKKVRDFTRSILEGAASSLSAKKDVSFESRITRIAVLLVKLGTNECIRQYRSNVEPNSVLNEPIIRHLIKTQEICEVIATKISSPHLNTKIDAGDLTYLFDWDKIDEIYDKAVGDLDDDSRALAEYVARPFSVDTIKHIRSVSYNRKEFRVASDEYGGDDYPMEGYLEIVEKDMCVNFVTKQEDGTNRLCRTLPLRVEDGHRHVYCRKGEDPNDLD